MILVDATTLIALGRIDEIGLLKSLDREVLIPEVVLAEVTTEPAATAVRTFVRENEGVRVANVYDEWESAVERALDVLGDDDVSGDVAILAHVIHRSNQGEDVAVVSDDTRVREVVRGLGATVTGTVGIIVRAAEEREMTANEGKELVRRVDSHGLHMTAELRERAYELVEDAARE